MNIGTKTLLFGCHQFILHPIFVYTAWVKTYHHVPNPTETLCIIIHDWGYWGKPNLDGPEGEDHPRWAAEFIYRHALSKYGDYYALCMYHSRFQARKHLASVSRLCLPDKLGVALMPTWLWVGLGSLTHEVDEYMAETKYEIHDEGLVRKSKSEFFKSYKEMVAKWVKTGDLTIRKDNTI